MTNEDWLRHHGLGWVVASAESGQITDADLRDFKRIAARAHPFPPSESFSSITEEMVERARRNSEFLRIAALLVPGMIDELLRLRRR